MFANFSKIGSDSVTMIASMAKVYYIWKITPYIESLFNLEIS
jgi:hypothetical protein